MRFHHRMFLVALCVAWIASSDAIAGEKPMKVFILSGQSNGVGKGCGDKLPAQYAAPDPDAMLYQNGGGMKGWQTLAPYPSQPDQAKMYHCGESMFGPEISLGRELRQRFPEYRIGIIKVCVGGTSVVSWSGDFDTNENLALRKTLYKENAEKQKNLHRLLVTEARNALAQIEGPREICGFVWVQTERDTQHTDAAAAWAGRVVQLHRDLAEKLDYSFDKVPFLVMGPHFHVYGESKAAHAAELFAGIRKTADEGGKVTLERLQKAAGLDALSAKDVEKELGMMRYWLPDCLTQIECVGIMERGLREQSVKYQNMAIIKSVDLPTHEGLHFNTEGQLELGRRFADAYVQLAAAQTEEGVKAAAPSFIWWEAENPDKTDFAPGTFNHPRLAEVASDGKWLQKDKGKPGSFVEYSAPVKQAGQYEFYVRRFWKHGPFRWRFDDGAWHGQNALRTGHERGNVLLDNEVIQGGWCLNWEPLGPVTLAAGDHRLRIELLEPDEVAGFDAFLLIQGRFIPRGKTKPDVPLAPPEPGWWHFLPEPDPIESPALDLRALWNEPFAGSKGFIKVKGGDFVHEKTGEPILFEGTNLGPGIWNMRRDYIDRTARALARRGINLVRLHGPVFYRDGPDVLRVNPDVLDNLLYTIEAFKKQGIYSEISFYFGSWVGDLGGIPGFEDFGAHNQSKERTFGAHILPFFHPEFQRRYKEMIRRVLTAQSPYSGCHLADDPAVMGVEFVNECTPSWWPFYADMPPSIRRELLRQYEAWLLKRHGSLEAARQAWGDAASKPADLLMPYHQVLQTLGTPRGRDQALFAVETHRSFNEMMVRLLRDEWKFKACLLSENWHTVNDTVLGAADTWAEDVCDFRDHHSYFYPGSIKTNRTAPDGSPLSACQSRSAIRGDALDGADKAVEVGFVNVIRNGKPNMCSEFAWMTNNPCRSESPLFVRAQSAVAGMKALTEFAQHQADVWLAEEVLEWPYNTPAILGQMPVAAAIFRQRGIREGEVLAAMKVNTRDALAFKPIPLKKSTRYDFNAQLGAGGRSAEGAGGGIANPALYFALGKVTLDVGDFPTAHEIKPLDPYFDPAKQVLRPSNGEIEWDLRRGLYRLQSRRVNGIVGFLNVEPKHDLPDVVIETPMDFGAIALASLDGRPIAESQKMLLQVMSQQRNSGWIEEAPDAKGHRVLLSRGGAPIQIKIFAGIVSLTRPDAARLPVTPLRPNFTTAGPAQSASRIILEPCALYYLIERKQ